MLEELQTKIKEQRSFGFSMAEVEASMREQGYAQVDIEQAIHRIGDQEMANFKQKHPLLSNKMFPLVMLLFTQALFFLLLPKSAAEEFSITFALIGGVMSLVFSFWTAAILFPSLLDKFPIATGITCISSLFIFGVAFIGMTTSYASNELDRYGKRVRAKVSDLSKIIGKRNDMYSMTVVFPCEHQVNCEASIDLSEREYDALEEGSDVNIIYSTEHPNIARIDYGR
ncbi:MAG: hypothetical protein JNM95_08650 [Chitinophagaceae bacterium]|nr:hypothetical protein [Chitinophagaceae bacterium]